MSVDLERSTWGWAGTASEFLAADAADILSALSEHHRRFFAAPPSGSQIQAWKGEIPVIAAALEQAVAQLVGADQWGVVLEYELPMEGGRRPDCVVLAGRTAVVVEFKEEATIRTAHFDQAEAYARDLEDYHSATRGLEVIPLLIPTGDVQRVAGRPGVGLVSPEGFGDALTGLARDPQQEINEWLGGSYAPLPRLVSAARRIFEHKPLPHARSAVSAHVPETVDRVSSLIRDAEARQLRRLVLVSGVPGAGKTLVGLRVVYEHVNEHAPATFLSGNGPLVQVLQDTLESRVFVRDLHAYIRQHGINGKPPTQQVVVFDEAQRAWDSDFMEFKKNIAKSEPEFLIDIGQRMGGWASLIGLVGEGQEIYTGEEGGLGQWKEAIERSGVPWQVCCPPHLAAVFEGLDVLEDPLLHLEVSLRSRRAERLHTWVSLLLGGQLEDAEDLARTIREEGFPMWLSRDLQEVKRHTIERYRGEPDARFGLLASSQAKNLADEGIDNMFQATKRIRIARWFNDGQESALSGCALTQPITEFQSQGLELDLPIVCWGDDMVWRAGAWAIKPMRRQYPLADPDGILINSYRVLLTRGRDGLMVWVPPQTRLDDTAVALQRAGLLPLPEGASEDPRRALVA